MGRHSEGDWWTCQMQMEAVLSVMMFERMRRKKGCMLRWSILCLVPDFVISVGDVKKDYVCGVCVLWALDMVHGRWRGQCASLDIP